MKNKKLCLLFSLALAMLIGVIWNFTSAVLFTLDFWNFWKPARWEFITKNITPIHFTDNGNDFGWFLYISNGIATDDDEVLPEYLVQAGDDKMECQQKVKWFYYSAERWERLWPLDGEANGIVAEGWIYTRCRPQWYSEEMKKCAWRGSESDIEECENDVRTKYVDVHGYYGMVTHEVWDQKFVLTAWTDYEKDATALAVNEDKLSSSLIRFDNKYPVWFIFDGNGWAWFLWCRVNEDTTLTSIFNKWTDNKKDFSTMFKYNSNKDGLESTSENLWVDCSGMWSAMNSLIWVIVDGLVWINRDTKNSGIQWNQSNDKMQYFQSVNVNNMQLINYARQRAEILCRWKWSTNKTSGGDILCLDGVSVNKEESNSIRNKWQTLIVKKWNVTVVPFSDVNDNKYNDIFIDEWNLIIEDDPNVELTVFKTNWFISENNLEEFKQEVYHDARGNDTPYSWDDVAAWKFIKWNFIVNGNIKAASSTWLDNIYFIYGKMTSKDTVDELKKVFKWTCNNGTGSDLQKTPCPGWWSKRTNPYENASLVIIDQNYPSPLYQ